MIIPVRNGGLYITECLNSVIAQENLGNIIVINDGSTDDTCVKVEEFGQSHKNIKLFTTEPRGLSEARNLGAAKAETKYIAFLDSDDYWELGKLASHVKHIKFDADCEFSFSLASEFGSNSVKKEQMITLAETPSFEDLLLQTFRITGSASSAVVSRSVFQELGGFDESMRYGEDLDLWVRMASRRMPCLLPFALTNIRVHENSMQRIRRSGDDRFLTTKTFCGIWQIYSHVLESPEFRNRASTILWADFRKNFSLRMAFNKEYDDYLKRNCNFILDTLKLKKSFNVGFSLMLRRISMKLMSPLSRKVIHE